MTSSSDAACATLSILMDVDLTQSTGLPLLLSTGDSSVYPNAHPKYTRVVARYQTNGAAQTILVVPDRVAGAEGPTTPPSTADNEACLPVDVIVLFEPTQASSAMHLATTGTCNSSCSGANHNNGSTASTRAHTPASHYLEAYLTTVLNAVVEDVQATLTPGPVTSAARLSRSPALDVVVHLLVCPNCTEASAGTNMTNTNLSVKDAALFAAAAQSVERQWRALDGDAAGPTGVILTSSTSPSSADTASAVLHKGVRRRKVGCCATVSSAARVTSFVLAIAGKHLKTLREDASATRAAATAATTASRGPTMMIPIAVDAQAERPDVLAAAQPNNKRPPCVGALTAEMIRPDVTRKCEPNDFVKLYQTMLSEIVSVSDRRAMAALSTFPTMHHLLAHVDSVLSGKDNQNSATTTAVYAQNFGEDRRYNVVNAAVVDALCTDYRQTE